jgi:hypothetical protein
MYCRETSSQKVLHVLSVQYCTTPAAATLKQTCARRVHGNFYGTLEKQQWLEEAIEAAKDVHRK